MPFNGSGTFVSLPPPDFPALPGTVILASSFNANMNDLFTNGLTKCLTRDGQSTPTANLPMAGFRLTNLGTGVADTDSAQLGQTLSVRGQVGTVDWDTRVSTGIFEATAASLTGPSANFPPTNELGQFVVLSQGANIIHRYETAYRSYLRRKTAGVWTLWSPQVDQATPVVLASNSPATVVGDIDSTDITISGTNNFNSLGAGQAGVTKRLRFSGILTMVHNPGVLLLANAINFTTAVDDVFTFLCLGGSVWMEVARWRSVSTVASINVIAGNGVLVKTAAGTATVRTITGTANEITLTNGDGVAGNPVVSLPATLSFAGKTITNGGAVTTVDINGGTVDGTVIGGAAAAAGTFTNLAGTAVTATTVVASSTMSCTTLTATTSINLTGGQIAFPATQVPSANVNTLDDYEEGTWTPVIGFAVTGDTNVVTSTQTGWYTKIGNLVTVGFAIVTTTFTHTTASGNMQITGLPFTPGDFAVGALRLGGVLITPSTTFDTVTLNAFPATAATNLIYGNLNSGVPTALTTANHTTGVNVTCVGTMTYKV